MVARMLAAAVILAVGDSLASRAAAPAAASTPAAQAQASGAKAVDVPVTRVVLFSSGVGYFEHNGAVTGMATAELPFETAQINDVLKSLVVFDKGGGAVGAVTYPANDPVNRTLRSFQVNLSRDPTLADILKQIRGARVRLMVADVSVTGTILGVEPRERPAGRAAPAGEAGGGGGVIHTWTVNIVGEAGIRSVALEDIQNLEIMDEKIKREMNQALAALVQARDQSKKTVTVHFDSKGAAGARTVGMGYLIETPIWKTTYRLLLPDGASKTADLQAWAIVENQTDNDWTNVSLSLVGGRPVSFIELLYQPIYASRPVVSPAVGSLVPQTYDNGITDPTAGMAGVSKTAPTINLGQSMGGGYGGGGGGGIFGQQQNANSGGIVGGQGGQGGGGQGIAPPAPNPMADFTQGVSAMAEATKIGEMFHFTVDKVTLPRQQSSMIPIIAEGVTVDRVSIYSPGASGRFAMRGVRLYNKTGKFLLGGPVTVIDVLKEGTSYAGDAKIGDVPAGQSRLLGYALDQDVVIQSKDQGDETLLSGKVLHGVLFLNYRSQISREYTLQNKGDGEKTLVIEHPITDRYDLKEPAKALEKTDHMYRFELKLAAKETRTFKVMLEQTRPEQAALADESDETIAIFLKQGSISAKVKEALQSIASKRGAMGELQRKIAQRTADRAQLIKDQMNTRENIKVLPDKSKSQEDAINMLTAQGDEIKGLDKEVKELNTALEASRQEFAKYVEALVVE